MSSILHIVRNPVSHDSRVLKETASIQACYPDEGLEIAGFHEPGYSETDNVGGRRVRRWRLSSRPLPKDLLSQGIKYTEWHYRLVGHYRQEPLKIIHCHDLGPLAIAVHLKKLTGAKLIYDAHELETETHGSRGLRQWLARHKEQSLMRFVDQMITVSPSIRSWYAERYPGIKIQLVRNIPDVLDAPAVPIVLREELGVPADSLLFLYLGGLGKGRGIEATLEGFNHAEVRHHVLFMGSGPLKDKVKLYAEKNQRIHYREPVPPSQVLAYAAGADIGLSLIEQSCLSYRFCLPNKLFESVIAGIPILASNLPDQARLVRECQAGWVVEPTAAAITEALCHLTVDEAQRVRDALPARTAHLRWSHEAKVLLEIYKGLLTSQDPA